MFALGALDRRSHAEIDLSLLGDQLSVDRVVPRAVAPEVDNVIANLELMPLRKDERKRDRVGSRQVDMSRKPNKAGLLRSA